MKYMCLLKITCNGLYHTRLVACGYSQVTGANVSQNFLPVMNNIMRQVLLLIMIHFGLVVDVETAFLYRELEEDIYVECPPGMKEISNSDCIIFQKCIYSLVQVTRQKTRLLK